MPVAQGNQSSLTPICSPGPAGFTELRSEDLCFPKLRNAFRECFTPNQKHALLARVQFHIFKSTAVASGCTDQTVPHPSGRLLFPFFFLPFHQIIYTFLSSDDKLKAVGLLKNIGISSGCLVKGNVYLQIFFRRCCKRALRVLIFLLLASTLNSIILSSRLTAFVLKSFAQSRGFIFIDPEELRAAKSWLIKHQREDGSFPAMGRILNKDLQVGLCLEDVRLKQFCISLPVNSNLNLNKNVGRKLAIVLPNVRLN